LVTDALGQRLAKRNDALTIRTLRNRGFTPEQIRMIRTVGDE
jgi:glutamyl/glutaminyl-tRNA synthetase